MNSASFPVYKHQTLVALEARVLEIREFIAARHRESEEEIAEEWFNALDLERELLEIQVRLGTPTERQDDFDRARAFAHKLANLMCVVLLEQCSANDQNETGACRCAPISLNSPDAACFGNRRWRNPIAVVCT
jgi:hypothetical protein